MCIVNNNKVFNLPCRIMCFDEASRQVGREPFERRYALILSHYAVDHPTIVSFFWAFWSFGSFWVFWVFWVFLGLFGSFGSFGLFLCGTTVLSLEFVKIAAPRFLCNTHRVLALSLKHVVEEGGEGIILRKPQSLYVPGRSDLLVKLKV
jgi:hypothetical protein